MNQSHSQNSHNLRTLKSQLYGTSRELVEQIILWAYVRMYVYWHG